MISLVKAEHTIALFHSQTISHFLPKIVGLCEIVMQLR
jgi:hypothetical protein